MDKKALLYLDDAKVISEILKEQNKRKTSKILTEQDLATTNQEQTKHK